MEFKLKIWKFLISPYSTSEFRVKKGLLIENLPVEKMRALSVPQYILRKHRVQSYFTSRKGKIGEAVSVRTHLKKNSSNDFMFKAGTISGKVMGTMET